MGASRGRLGPRRRRGPGARPGPRGPRGWVRRGAPRPHRKEEPTRLRGPAQCFWGGGAAMRYVAMRSLGADPQRSL